MILQLTNPDIETLQDVVQTTDDVTVNGSVVVKNIDADALGNIVQDLDASSYNFYEDEDEEMQNPLPKESKTSNQKIKKEDENKKVLPKPKQIKEEKEVYEEPEELTPEEIEDEEYLEEKEYIEQMSEHLTVIMGKEFDEPKGRFNI